MAWLPRSIKVLLLACIAIGIGDAVLHAQETSSRRTGAQAVENLQAAKPRPNIILISLDDADVDLFSDAIVDQFFPNIKTLATTGLRFTNCHVTTPLCGPSRACLLRGQHAHRTGIKTNTATGRLNNGYTGSYDVFKQKGFEEEHLGVWMQRAGYRTMMIGKYSHGRMDPTDLPGWNDLYICFGGAYYQTSRYASRLPLAHRRNQTGPEEYRTVVETGEAVGMIEAQHQRNTESTDEPQPFFLYLAPLAPHLPARNGKMLQKEYEDLARTVRIPETPDFNEEDISDKPSFLQYKKLTDAQVEAVHKTFRDRVVATKSVDDMVGRLVEVLERLKLRENTYLFFTSDHGYQLGHNRMIAKKLPYHRNTVVPMFVTGPNVKQGSSDHLLAHIDMTATFLDIANAEAPIELDGKSWLPLLSDPDRIQHDEFRSSMLIQNWEIKSQLGEDIPACYASLRTHHQIFTQWSSGEHEYYDLKLDPYQLENKIDSLTADQKQTLTRQLHAAKQGQPSPVVTFNTPDLICKTTTIRGLFEVDNSADEVELEILDPLSNVYWNGRAWQTQKSSVPASLANRHGLISDWSYTVDLSTIKHDGQIDVVLRGRDQNGRVSKDLERSFKVDAIEPETILVKPIAGGQLTSPVMIRGECSDNHELVGVEITLHWLDNNTYWNGQEWTKGKSTFFKRAAKKLWHIEVIVPPGRYVTSVRALDSAGNYDASPSQSEFSIK